MKYINSIVIKTFKGLENLRFSNLGDINILVGDNNTCKTSVLEAIQLFQYPNDIREVIRIARKREIIKRRPSNITVMESFLNMFNASQKENKNISIECEVDRNIHLLDISGVMNEIYVTSEELIQYKSNQFDEESSVSEFKGILTYDNNKQKITINDVNGSYIYRNSDIDGDRIKLLDLKFVSSSDHLNETFSVASLSEAIKNNEKSQLLELLRKFDDKIDGIEILPGRNNHFPTTYIKHSEYGFMPLSSFGDGIKKVLALASAVLRVENGLLLIDELETAIHTSALDSVFEWLLETCKLLNIQVIATTHSDEALISLLSKYKKIGTEMCIYRLERFENEIVARRFSGNKAYDIIVNNGGDLR